MENTTTSANMSQTSMYDYDTLGENLTLDLGDENISSLTSSSISTITLNDITSLGNTITLPATTWDPSTSTYTISTSGGGGGGTTWTTTGTGYNWANPYQTNVHIDADGLTMKEGADIKIGGKSLTEAIEKIEERLGILKPNPELEERWDKLKELRQQYIELEKDLLEKEKIMKILKET